MESFLLKYSEHSLTLSHQFLSSTKWRHDTRHNDIQHNDTRRKAQKNRTHSIHATQYSYSHHHNTTFT